MRETGPLRSYRSALSGILAFVCSCALAQAGSSAGSPANFQPNAEAREIVRKVVANELKQEDADKSHYMFKLKKVTPKGTKLQTIVQTDQGSIARTLVIDGHPPSQEDVQSEQDKIHRLINDADEQKRRQKRDREDENRAQIMVRALPNAFFFQEIGRDGDTLKLRFRPDPDYRPQSHEESVYTGMAGELWLNTAQQRLQKIDAQLFHDVDFGWGILGRLYKGGSFMVQQEQVDATHWDTTVTKLDLTGKAMMFKSLVYKEQEYQTDYRRLPDHLSIAQGFGILMKDSSEVAQKSGQ
jgi:hypothetical protein